MWERGAGGGGGGGGGGGRIVLILLLAWTQDKTFWLSVKDLLIKTEVEVGVETHCRRVNKSTRTKSNRQGQLCMFCLGVIDRQWLLDILWLGAFHSIFGLLHYISRERGQFLVLVWVIELCTNAALRLDLVQSNCLFWLLCLLHKGQGCQSNICGFNKGQGCQSNIRGFKSTRVPK